MLAPQIDSQVRGFPWSGLFLRRSSRSSSSSSSSSPKSSSIKTRSRSGSAEPQGSVEIRWKRSSGCSRRRRPNSWSYPG